MLSVAAVLLVLFAIAAAEPPIDVTLSASPGYEAGLLATMNSALRHTSAPLRFSIALDRNDTRTAGEVRAAFPSANVRFAVFEQAWAKDACVWGERMQYVHRNAFTFSRFYLGKMWSDLRRVIVLDTDTVVQADLRQLWHVELGGDGVLAAVEECEHPYGMLFAFQDAAVRARLRDPAACGFNAGVLVVDMVAWRRLNKGHEVAAWLKANCERRLYELGSQPPLNLAFPAGRYTRLDQRWNTRTLGWNSALRREALDAAYILHWNGQRKPWAADGLYRERWSVYRLQ